MRVREGEGATKWSICGLCLEKVRGVGDLVAYVRMIREGVVKVGDKKDEEEAWEELVRLRERLFWARMAGGVVPAFLPTPKQTPVDLGPDEDGKENSTPDLQRTSTPNNAITPQERPSVEVEETDKEEVLTEEEARLRLQKGVDASLTNFGNPKNTPPRTPSPLRKNDGNGGREGFSFPKINIPRLPTGFWEGQVNTLN